MHFLYNGNKFNHYVNKNHSYTSDNKIYCQELCSTDIILPSKL